MKDDVAGSAKQREKRSSGSEAFQPNPAAKELLDHIAELLAREYIELLEEAAEPEAKSDSSKEDE